MKTFVTIVLIVIAATLVFYAAVHQIAGLWLDVVLRPDVRDVIEHSLLDQKALRNLDPANAPLALPMHVTVAGDELNRGAHVNPHRHLEAAVSPRIENPVETQVRRERPAVGQDRRRLPG